jgi:hypothetical protein
MDDFSDYLPILAALFYYLFAARKKKKRKAANQEDGQAETLTDASQTQTDASHNSQGAAGRQGRERATRQEEAPEWWKQWTPWGEDEQEDEEADADAEAKRQAGTSEAPPRLSEQLRRMEHRPLAEELDDQEDVAPQALTPGYIPPVSAPQISEERPRARLRRPHPLLKGLKKDPRRMVLHKEVLEPRFRNDFD